MHVCTYIRIYIRMYIRTHMYMYAFMYIHTYVCICIRIYISNTHTALTFENLWQVHLGRRCDAFLGRNSEKSVYAERGRAARRCQEDEKAQSDFIITAQIFIITAQIPV